MLDKELLEISLEALAKHKNKIEITNKSVKSLERLMSKTIDGLDENASKLDIQLSELNKNMKSSVKSEMSKIPIPKDGIDGKSVKGIPGKDGKSIQGKAGKDGISIQGKPGKDGKSIKGEPGKPGKDGIGKPGKDGEDGSDGVGIKEVRGNSNEITIELTNGQEKTIKLPKSKGRGAGGGFTDGTPANNSVKLLTDTTIEYPSNGEVLTYQDGKWINETPAGGVVDIDNFQRRTEIEAMFKTSSSTAYKELTYGSGNITNVDIYETSGKSVKLFSKVIGYNVDNNIDAISITDEVNSDAIYKALAYTGSDLTSITSTYAKA